MKKFIILIYHIIAVSLMTISVLTVNNSYWIVCWMFILCIITLVDYFVFASHVKKYPLNVYEEYKLNIYNDVIYEEQNNCYVIKIIQNNNIYITTTGLKTLKFDMTGCICPLNIIRAYFIRNIHFRLYNKNRSAIFRFTFPYKIPSKYNLNNLKVVFVKSKKSRSFWLIKNSRTKLNFYIKMIMSEPLNSFWSMYKGNFGRYIKITEQDYVIRK